SSQRPFATRRIVFVALLPRDCPPCRRPGGPVAVALEKEMATGKERYNGGEQSQDMTEGARVWSARSEALTGARGLRFAVDVDSRPATFAEVLRGWQGDVGFRAVFNALLADAPYTAFRWETPAVTTATLVQPFEFVLLDSPGLARPP